VLGAALLLTLIDVLMGFDNVLALAAVAGDSTLYLTFGLTLSIAILMFGSTLMGPLLHRFPEVLAAVVGSAQKVMLLRTPSTNSLPSFLPVVGLATPAPGLITYWTSGCSCSQGVICA